MQKGIQVLSQGFMLSAIALSAGIFSIHSQSLPQEMYLSTDGRMLFTGGTYSTGFYDSSQIRNVYLNFPQANYWSLMQANYNSKTNIPATMIVDGISYDSVGVRFKGNTSYTQLPQNSQKKSFNISTDFVHDGQDLMGYSTLNFNNSFQDESFLREVFFLHQIRKHVPAAKGNFIHLYLNNADWGIYPNVQQLNKDFLEEWFLSNDGANWRADRPSGGGGGPGGPGWGDGTAALNYLGPDTASYQTYYTLKSSDVNNPWSYLVAGCNALNNTSQGSMTTVLPNYFDIDRILWFLASEIAFSDDDSYVMKGKMDYYVYYEPETGRLTPIEFDGNSIMENNALTWSPFYHETNVNYPLLNKILAVPEWRQRYLAHLRTVIAEEINPTECNTIFDNYKAQIDALVQSDPKKIYTYTQFNSEVTTLKNWINTRRTNLLANSEVSQVGPAISSVTCYNSSSQAWTAPLPAEQAHVTAAISSGNGIDHVTLYYSTQIVGNFTKVQMYDDGAHNDGAPGDGVYGGAIPGQIVGTWVRFYIEAVAANAALSASYMPVGAEHNVYVYQVQSNVSPVTGVVINELMASNSTTVQDGSGEYDDWIELYNNNNVSVDLSGFYLTDNPFNLDKWEIPAGTTIPAYGYLIYWADEDSSQGPANHCNFKLSGSGEVLYLLDANLDLVDSITFGAQITDMGYARVPNGTGGFIIQNPTFNVSNDPLGIEEDGFAEIGVYPNPASDMIYINTNLPDATAFEIRNAIGQTVYNGLLYNQLTLNTSDWASGLYILSVGNGSEKIIVSH